MMTTRCCPTRRSTTSSPSSTSRPPWCPSLSSCSRRTRSFPRRDPSGRPAPGATRSSPRSVSVRLRERRARRLASPSRSRRATDGLRQDLRWAPETRTSWATSASPWARCFARTPCPSSYAACPPTRSRWSCSLVSPSSGASRARDSEQSFWQKRCAKPSLPEKQLRARLVVVDVVDEHAVSFYERYGFIRTPQHGLRLYRRMKDVSASLSEQA